MLHVTESARTFQNGDIVRFRRRLLRPQSEVLAYPACVVEHSTDATGQRTSKIIEFRTRN